jgi:hypothetical protein
MLYVYRWGVGRLGDDRILSCYLHVEEGEALAEK